MATDDDAERFTTGSLEELADREATADVDVGIAAADLERAAEAMDHVDDVAASYRAGTLSGRELEELRRSLPTDPVVARLVQAGLPPALAETLEYVSASGRQDAYWRSKRERRDPEALSNAELRARRAFAETAHDQRGRDGITTTADADGSERVISRTAAGIRDRLAGASFTAAEDPPTQTDKRRFDRLRARFERVIARLF
jgi:hypothetical protein